MYWSKRTDEGEKSEVKLAGERCLPWREVRWERVDSMAGASRVKFFFQCFYLCCGSSNMWICESVGAN